MLAALEMHNIYVSPREHSLQLVVHGEKCGTMPAGLLYFDHGAEWSMENTTGNENQVRHRNMQVYKLS